jgi:tetratricopeptide (TPR) repeat protein
MPPEVTIDDSVLAGVIDKLRANVMAQPQDPAAWGQLGQTLIANGILEPAGECFREAGRLAPQDPRWPYLEGVSLLLRDPVAAIPCWQRAAECPGDDERTLIARLRWGEVLLANDRQNEAESAFRGILDHHPDNIRAHFGLGLLASARNDPKSGIEHLLKCIEHPAARRKARSVLAKLYTSQGKNTEAAEFARHVEDLPPDQEWPDPILEETISCVVGRESLFLQAEKQLQQGDSRQAILLFEEVIHRYPDEARAHVKLGMILTDIGEYRYAEEVLRTGLRVAPDMVQGHYFLTAVLYNQAERAGLTSSTGKEKLQEAVVSARKTISLKSDHGFAHIYLGLALKHLGQKSEAIAALREAVHCTPEATDPHLHLGQALWEEGQVKEGLAELEIAARIASPNDKRPQAALDRVRKTGTKPDREK